jgi:hypothetical protein
MVVGESWKRGEEGRLRGEEGRLRGEEGGEVGKLDSGIIEWKEDGADLWNEWVPKCLLEKETWDGIEEANVDAYDE